MSLLKFRQAHAPDLRALPYFKHALERHKKDPEVTNPFLVPLLEGGVRRIQKDLVDSDSGALKIIIYTYKQEDAFHSVGLLLACGKYAGLEVYQHKDKNESRTEIEWLMWLKALQYLESEADQLRIQLGLGARL